MRPRLVPALILFLATGCATAPLAEALGYNYTVQPLGDAFNPGVRGNIMRNNYIPSESAPGSGASLQLNAGYIVAADSTSTFIQAVYQGQDWIFVEPGESLVLLIDGERVAVSGGRSERDVRRQGGIAEIVLYPVPDQLLARLGSAMTVRVRLQGTRGISTNALSDANKLRFQQFSQNNRRPTENQR